MTTNQIRNPKALRSETTLMPWFIWLLAVLFYAYEFTQRVSLNIYWPYLSKDLVASTAAIGIMNSFFYWAYALMQIPAGMLIDKLGTRRLATLGILLVSLGSLYFSSVHTIADAAVARLVIGIGASVAFICAMKLIIVWFPPYRFALVAGLTNLAGYLGASMGQVPLNIAVNHFGWREAAWGSTIIGFALTVLIFLYLRDKPYKPHRHRGIEPPSIFKGLRKILSKPMNWHNGLYTMLMMGPTSAFAALWGKSFLTGADHISGGMAAGAVTAIFIGVAVGSPIFGWLTEYIGKRQRLLVFAAFGAMLSTSVLVFFNDLPLTMIYVVCFAFGFFQSAHVLNFAIAKGINAKKNSGAAMGFTNMAAVLGGAWLQPLIGFLLEHQSSSMVNGTEVLTVSGYHIALLCIPICQFVALLLAMFCLNDNKQNELAKKAHRMPTQFVY
jgi:MFS family permease